MRCKGDGMGQPPRQMGGMPVVQYAVIDGRCRPTGNCRHFGAGLLDPAAGLAICRDVSSSCFYLFGCNSRWQEFTDTCHDTLDEAIRQAEFEYAGISACWVKGQGMD